MFAETVTRNPALSGSRAEPNLVSMMLAANIAIAAAASRTPVMARRPRETPCEESHDHSGLMPAASIAFAILAFSLAIAFA